MSGTIEQLLRQSLAAALAAWCLLLSTAHAQAQSKRITTGADNFVCALRADDTIACWGDSTNTGSPPSAEQFSQISGGYRNSTPTNMSGAGAV
ncbi:MAG TPA: hypothetical protein VGJ91_06425 [Polyangiaceae bacterium]|jgi:hypothetical protein